MDSDQDSLLQAIGFTRKNHSYPSSPQPSSTERNFAAVPWASFLSHAPGASTSKLGQEPKAGQWRLEWEDGNVRGI